MGRKRREGSSRIPPGVEDAQAKEKAREARKALEWVIGRLAILEYLILFFAMALALLGGALVAWVLLPLLPVSFRWSWATASLLLFILPGGLVYLRESRKRGRDSNIESNSTPKEKHD